MKDNYKISDFLPYLIFGIAVVIILIILKPITMASPNTKAKINLPFRVL